jgi:cytochrome c-type biogenesis protein CcmH
MIWLAFGILTGLAILSVLWPLSRPSAQFREGDADIAFYRAQIAELDADARRGLIDPAEAEIARFRAARRLLALDMSAPASMPSRRTGARRLAALSATIAIPAVAFGLYAHVGDPARPDQPLQARLQQERARAAQDAAKIGGATEALVAAIERRLADHPENGRDFELLAPLYQRLGRWDDAVHAREEALRLLGETAPRHEALGEAMIDAREGVVTIEANEHFERALALDPKMLEARFYIGLGAAQDGDAVRARAIWTDLIREAPVNSTVKAETERRLATLDALEPK